MGKKKTKQWNRVDPLSVFLALGLVIVDVIIWYNIVFVPLDIAASPRVYFLDVGQGDSELVVLPGNVKIMTDAGPDNKVEQSLAKVLSQGDGYIDLAIISHPEADHFGGYNSLLDHYRIGAIIYNGRDAESGNVAWEQLRAKIKNKNIPIITLAKGDAIRYGNNEVDMLSPSGDFAQSAELNDTGLVELVKTPPFTSLFTADTGSNVEDFLLANHVAVHADVLKIPHHGSKYASSEAFLRAVDPRVAVIEVGAKNTFGQPSKEVLARIASSTSAKVFRTDEDGTIAISAAEGGALDVIKER